jgi:hypothetical protein
MVVYETNEIVFMYFFKHLHRFGRHYFDKKNLTGIIDHRKEKEVRNRTITFVPTEIMILKIRK